jgi:hypothetical protein
LITFDDFTASLTASAPPVGCSPLLSALWHDKRGDWEKAHQLAQAVDDADGALVHAYLHRKEGDLANAAYWYRRAGRPVTDSSLDDEWAAIVRELIGRTG